MKNQISRRNFMGQTASAAVLAAIPGGILSCTSPSGSTGSKFGGVQIGAISYSFRSMSTNAESILGYLLESGITSVELMGNTIEEYAGIPQIAVPVYPRGTELSPEQQAEMRAARQLQTEEFRKWRLSVNMDKFRALRKLYNDAGINIDIAKLGNPSWTDGEIDYAFTVAKILGARGITMEISKEAAERMAPFAEKHRLFAIFHNHLQPGQPGFSFEEFLAYGPYLMLNFDAGHYFGATGKHPNEIIERLYGRIASIHIKDKTGPDSSPPNTNMPFGLGETPLADMLLLLKEKRWPITADIELEYPVPEGSDAVKEVRRCVEYCKNILT